MELDFHSSPLVRQSLSEGGSTVHSSQSVLGINCPPSTVNRQLTFTYGNNTLVLSTHAYGRLKERAGCFGLEEASELVQDMLQNGFESRLKGKQRPERLISIRDISLHVRENVITTVTYNLEYCKAV